MLWMKSIFIYYENLLKVNGRRKFTFTHVWFAKCFKTLGDLWNFLQCLVNKIKYEWAEFKNFWKDTYAPTSRNRKFSTRLHAYSISLPPEPTTESDWKFSFHNLQPEKYFYTYRSLNSSKISLKFSLKSSVLEFSISNEK